MSGYPARAARSAPIAAGRQDRIQPMFLQHRVDPFGPAEQVILANVRVVAGAIGFEIHFIRNVDARLSVAGWLPPFRGPGSIGEAR